MGSCATADITGSRLRQRSMPGYRLVEAVGRLDQGYRAGSAGGAALADRSEQQAGKVGPAADAEHEQIGGALLSRRDQRLRRVALGHHRAQRDLGGRSDLTGRLDQEILVGVLKFLAVEGPRKGEEGHLPAEDRRDLAGVTGRLVQCPPQGGWSLCGEPSKPTTIRYVMRAPVSVGERHRHQRSAAPGSCPSAQAAGGGQPAARRANQPPQHPLAPGQDPEALHGTLPGPCGGLPGRSLHRRRTGGRGDRLLRLVGRAACHGEPGRLHAETNMIFHWKRVTFESSSVSNAFGTDTEVSGLPMSREIPHGY